jgi:hypothetical protein
MHRWTAVGGSEGRRGSREAVKKNAKENANRPLDITGEIFLDLSCFYLACLPLTSTNTNFVDSLSPLAP